MHYSTVILYVLIAVFTLPGFIFGYKKIVADDSKIVHFQRLGIPVPWMRLLGLVEVLGGIALFVPSLRLAGMVVWLVILLGANYYNITKNEPKEELYASIGVLALWIVIAGMIWWSTTN